MSNIHIRRSFHALFLGTVMLAACGTPEVPKQEPAIPVAPPPPALVPVDIAMMKFQPDTVRIHKGDTILFTNKDVVEHDATALPDSAWTTGPLQPGQSKKMVIDKSTDYFCSIHVVMRGRVEVAP